MDIKYTESQKTVYTLQRKRKNSNFNTSTPFELLPNETPDKQIKRHTLYKKIVNHQELTAITIKNEINVRNIRQCMDLIRKQNDDQIDSLVLLPNSSISTSTNYIKELTNLVSTSHIKFIDISSKEDSTMKAIVKTIIYSIVGDEEVTFDKRLYDLDFVVDFIKDKKDYRIVLVFSDVDSFNVNLLNQLLKLLNCYKSKLTFKLLFNIEISLESFLLKLSSDYDLNIQTFEIEQTDNILNNLIDNILNQSLQLDSELTSMILQRFQNGHKTVEDFTKMLKFSTMSFFYGNYLSVLFDDIQINDSYAMALRTLPSFKAFIKNLSHSSKYKSTILNLLNDSDELTTLVKNSQKIYEYSLAMFKVVYKMITRIFVSTLKINFSHLDVYNKLSNPNEFIRFQFINTLISTMKTKVIELNQLTTLKNKISELSEENDSFTRLNMKLQALHFKTAYETSNKLQFDIEFRKLKENFIDVLSTFLKSCIRSNDAFYEFYLSSNFDQTKINIFNWQINLFNEIFLLNDAQIVERNLVPDYRNTLIDALINSERYIEPNQSLEITDYSNLSDQDILNQLDLLLDPLLSSLYQIQRETSLYINIYDFYNVFKMSTQYEKVIKLLKLLVESKDFENYLNDDERYAFLYSFFNSQEEEIWDKVALAWFYQKCEELVWLGYLTSFGNRKRKDILEKVVWKDL